MRLLSWPKAFRAVAVQYEKAVAVDKAVRIDGVNPRSLDGEREENVAEF